MDEAEEPMVFVDGLCKSSAIARRVLDESVRDNEEFLLYLFLGDLARAASDLFMSSPGRAAKANKELTELFEAIEQGYRNGSKNVRGVIAVGFLEGLGGPPHPDWRVRRLLGSKTRNAIERIWPSGLRL